MRRLREAAARWDATASPVLLCDVNVLVAASRNDHLHHLTAKQALQEVFDHDKPFGVSTHLLAAMVRICTSSKVFTAPTSAATAFAVAQLYQTYPNAVSIEPGADHWRIFRSLVLGASLSGGAISDAWHAALAIEAGCEWWTFDREFTTQRFPGLRVHVLPT